MLRDYTAEKGLAQGLMETFDGEHPCAMCGKIAKAREQEEQKIPLTQNKNESLSKWLTLSPATDIPDAGWTDIEPALRAAESEGNASSRRGKPPLPPPRFLV
jgi:hypothetical protein